VLPRVDAEDLVGEGLADEVDFREIEDNLFEAFEAGQQATGLKSGLHLRADVVVLGARVEPLEDRASTGRYHGDLVVLAGERSDGVQ
jgi:hypothetical protein